MKKIILLISIILTSSILYAQGGRPITDEESIRSSLNYMQKSVDSVTVEQYNQLVQIDLDLAKTYPRNVLSAGNNQEMQKLKIREKELRDSLYSTILSPTQITQYREHAKKCDAANEKWVNGILNNQKSKNKTKN